jgi:putative DNA primase/helicase
MLGEVQTPAAGAPSLVLLVAEGYATGASLHEATGRPVAVAFDAGNLVHVARELRRLHPAALLLICADNDTATEATTGRNPGREAGSKAAQQAGAALTWPDGLPEGASDFNDLHAHAGLDAVRQRVEAAIADALAEGESEKPDKAPKRERNGQGRGAADAGPDEAASGPRDRFRVDDSGVLFDPPGDEGGGPRRVCDALHAVAIARDAMGNQASMLLTFNTQFGEARQWLMPLTMLAGDGAAYRSELLGQGFMCPVDGNRRRWLTEYLQSRRPTELVRLTDRVGWHGTAYVLPRETLGETGDERIMFHQSGIPLEASFQQRGTTAQWRERVGKYCEGNSRLTLAV